MSVARRPDLFVVARFLERLSEPGPWTRSGLQRAVGVNYDVFRRYLELLAERGHLVVRKRTVAITDRGRRFQEELKEWLRAFFDMPP